MNWTDIKVGSEYTIRGRKVEGDERDFVGFHVHGKNVFETVGGRNKLCTGRLMTIDGTFSKGELVTLTPESLLNRWIITDEQKLKEEEYKKIVDASRLSLETRIKDLGERLDARLGSNRFITYTKRKVEIGLSIADNVEDCLELVEVLDKLYALLD